MSDKETIFQALMGGRSPEVWIALFAGTLYVYRKSENPSRMARVIEAGISCMLGYAVAPDAAEWAGANPALAHLAISSLGYLALDFATSIIADREALKQFLLAKLGGGKNQ